MITPMAALRLGTLTFAHLTADAPEVQDPEGTAGLDPASSGATEIDGQGKFASAEPSQSESEIEKTDDKTDFTLSTGGIFSTGNARSVAITGSGNLLLRRKIHQFGATVAGNYGASADTGSEWRDTVGNVQGRVRYDAFFAPRWSAFLMTTGRHDPFQGLDFRLNIDPGVAFYALKGPANRLWFEVGYDFQYDLRSADAVVATDDNDAPILDADGETIRIAEDTAINHAARIYIGYSNRMTEKVSFDTGLEWLQSVTVGSRFRFVYDAGLTAQVAERLAISTTFTLRYEHEPLPGVEKLDTITAANLIYRFI